MKKNKNKKMNQFVEDIVSRCGKFEDIVQNFPNVLNPLPVSFIKLMTIILFLFFPLVTFNVKGMLDTIAVPFFAAYLSLILTGLVFVWNQRYFVPSLFFRKRYFRYVLVNFVCLILTVVVYQVGIVLFSQLILGKSIPIYELTDNILETFLKFLILDFFICFINIILFVSSLQIQSFYQQYIKKQTELEMKNDFLKRQLSPHFLFNSINNIISMMDIDVKKSKMQMFDLVSILRSLLYENKENMVSLGKEIDFLKCFINLEKMRFDDSMEITFVSNCEKSEKQCMPFLFLPLLENSFKHSLNINGNSFIHIEITEEENSVTYKSENTNFPRKKKDGVSGGLGLENFKKRLDLIYADRYEYNVTIEENVYKVYLKVNL